MTPTEIATHLIAQTALTEETMAPIYEYRREKRATGAPTDLEIAVIHAAKECQDAADALARYLHEATTEAAQRANIMARHGVRFSEQTWFTLDSRTNAESLNRVLRTKREHFQALVATWAAVADRIVATDEDRARAAAEKRERAVATFSQQPVRDLRALAAKHGIKVGTGRAEIATALVDAGVEP
jgi:hypothetical protein